jgi:phage terminase large subunit GpA-like protein
MILNATTPPSSDGLIASIFGEAIAAAIPDALLTVPDWADTYRVVSQGPETGTKWNTSRVPFLKDILDCVTDRRVREIVLWSSSRVGKTEGVLNNIVGYFMHIDPAPIMMVQPTLDMAEKYSRDRLTSLIRETPVLRDLVEDPRTRDSGNTLLHKTFRGGHISIVGANSPVGLASEDIRVLLLDEVDRFPKIAGSEGDPVSLAKRRTQNYRDAGDSLVVMTSSPLIEGDSRIETAYNLSDRCELLLACSGCGEFTKLVWSQVKWTDLDLPASQACYVCPVCGVIIEEDERRDMLQNYRWRSQVAAASVVGHLTLDEWRSHPHFNGIAGFQVSGLASPFITLGQLAEELTEASRAKSLPMKQSFVNTGLGELWKPWEEIDKEDLKFHVEDYRAEVPAPVALLTFAVDTQFDRLEVEVAGWGVGDERWSIDYQVFRGDPARVEIEGETTVWDELWEYLEREWHHELGVTMKVRAGCIDSGGAHTDAVYQFVKKAARARKLWWAIKGSAIPGRPIAPKKASRVGRQNVALFTVGTEVAKDRIASCLKIESGPGSYHFPATYEEDYFDQLTSERGVNTYNKKGYSVRRWEKIRAGARNEAWDNCVYNLAAKEILRANLKHLYARLLQRVEVMKSAPASHGSPAEAAPRDEAGYQDDRRGDPRPPPAGSRNSFRFPRRRGGFTKNW